MPEPIPRNVNKALARWLDDEPPQAHTQFVGEDGGSDAETYAHAQWREIDRDNPNLKNALRQFGLCAHCVSALREVGKTHCAGCRKYEARNGRPKPWNLIWRACCRRNPAEAWEGHFEVFAHLSRIR